MIFVALLLLENRWVTGTLPGGFSFGPIAEAPPEAPPRCRHRSFGEFCPPCLAEYGPGIAAKTLPPARERWVCPFLDEDLMGVDVK